MIPNSNISLEGNRFEVYMQLRNDYFTLTDSIYPFGLILLILKLSDFEG